MLKREEMVSSIPATPWRWAFTALAAAALAACGSGEHEPSNDLPKGFTELGATVYPCLLYTSPSPRDRQKSRMPSSA